MTKFHKAKNLSPWRKISLVFWKKPQDPTVYFRDQFNAEPLLAFIESENQKSDVKITPTHAIAKAVGMVIAKHKALNAIVRWGNIYYRESVDMFLQVAVEDPENPKKHHLSGVKIENIDQKSIQQIAQELVSKSRKIRKNEDVKFKKMFTLSRKVPVWLLRLLVPINEFLTFNLGISIPALGVMADPFGSAMLTSVGSLGLPAGFAPLVPPSRTPMVVALGAIKKQPWVENDELTVKSTVDFGVTLDHRVVDGLHGAQMHRTFEHILTDPAKYLK